MDSSEKQILALIPAYNESDRLLPVVSASLAHLPVLVVDDGSGDGTGAVAAEAGAEVLRQEPNQGKGAALQSGFRWALARDLQAVVTLDADGQHDPEEIPKFLKLFETKQTDLIIGARDFSQMPPTRRIANSLGRWSFSWAMGQSILDNQSGYRLLGQRMMAAMVESEEGGFEFEVEMIVRCVMLGYQLDWVPIRTIYAGESSHIQPWEHSVNFTRLVFQTRRRLRAG